MIDLNKKEAAAKAIASGCLSATEGGWEPSIAQSMHIAGLALDAAEAACIPTMMSDKDGAFLAVGDVVRTPIDSPFQEVHGQWADYEIGLAPGGFILQYFRSEKGAVLPFGYTAQYMTEYGSEELPGLKGLLWAKDPVRHPLLEKLLDVDLTPDQRRSLFADEQKERRGA